MEFPFITVMFAVIMGMGVVYILVAIATIIRGFRNRIIPYWLHMAWILFLLLLHFHVWWGLWDFQEVSSWNYFKYLLLLSGPVLLFVAAAIIIPEENTKNTINLQKFYFNNNTKFFLTLSFAVIWGLLLYPVFLGKMDPVFKWLILFLLIMIILSFTKKPIVHVILSIIAWILFFIWILSYGFSISNA